MMRRLFTDPLLIREMIAGMQQSGPVCSACAGLRWTLVFCGLISAVFVFYGKHDSIYSSCCFFIVLAWLQSWLLFRRSGSFLACSVSGGGERGAMRVLRASPFSIEHALLAKFAGMLMPLGLEIVLVMPVNAAVFMGLGCVPAKLFLSVCVFQLSMALIGASVGALFGYYMEDSAKAVKLYRQFALWVALLGAAMCYSSGLGSVMLTLFVLYLLLFLLPAFSDKLSIISGLLAVFMMIVMPFALMLNLSPFYDTVKSTNPFSVLWQTQPVDLGDTRSLLLSKLGEDRSFHNFARSSYVLVTDGDDLSEHPRWLEIYSNAVGSDPYAAHSANEMYLSWRMRNLYFCSLGLMLFFFFSFGLLWRKTLKDARLGS